MFFLKTLKVWLFQLDDEPILSLENGESLEIAKHPIEVVYGFQIEIRLASFLGFWFRIGGGYPQIPMT